MKAALLKGVENLDFCDFPTPVAKNKDIVVKVKACGVCGTDVKTYRQGHRFIKYPSILGHELSGEVVQLGKEVASFKIGDRVQVAAAIPCGKCFYCYKDIQSMCENLTVVSCHYHGGFAEYMLVPENFILNKCVNKIPENLSYQNAALAEPLACVINAQELSNIKQGESLLIIGAGPMGCFHAQLAYGKGVKKVIMCDTDEKRLEFAKFTKSDRFINPSVEELESVIREVCDGRLVDQIMVVSGSAALNVKFLKLISPRGTVNLFGGFKKEQLADDIDKIQYGECRLIGSYGSSPRHNSQAISVLSSGTIDGDNYITKTFSLSQVQEALEITEERQGLKNMVLP
jgi:L-iditol 2-dehydrogenase